MRLRDHRQLRAFLATVAPLGLAACADRDLGKFEGQVCADEPTALSALAPRDGVDYVALRSLDVFADPPAAQVTAEWGVACKSANDPAACATALAALGADGTLWRHDSFGLVSAHDMVFTAGDETRRVLDMASLLELLGPIDTPNEALLVAHTQGHRVPCGEPNWRRGPGGITVVGTRGESCGGEGRFHYEIIVASDGSITLGREVKVEDGDPNCSIGRRPDGLCSRTRMARRLGDFFANAAHLEAASVPAFAQLARELVAHGAPRKLVRAAWQARREEIRHARATAALARRFGAAPIRPRVEPRPVRSLFAMALDNATEGCVRETFGAAAAAVQAARATDPAVRRAMRPIARDEASHATLSWAIDEWAQSKLRPADRRAMREARDEAVAALRDESAHRWSQPIRHHAGMPGVEAAMRMIEPMAACMWHA